MTLSPTLIPDLESALHHRSIRQGIAMLLDAEHGLATLHPCTPHAARLLLLLAEWIDVGFRDYRSLDPLLARFDADCRKSLPLQDYVYVRMAEAFRALAVGDSERSIQALELVLRLTSDLLDQGTLALAHFWKARAHRKKGEYESALGHIVRARELAQQQNDRTFTAVIQIQEGWLLFQKGIIKDALRILADAESVLKDTDHYVALGNIESARGRIVRRLGEYSRALEHFALANRLYEKQDSRHVNLARSLVNAAYVQRLLALQVRKKIDRTAGSGRPATPLPTRAPGGESLRSRYQSLCHEALHNLNRARDIYEFHADQDGIGKVTLNLGSLHLDRGDIDRATTEAAEAYRRGGASGDRILMARARILQTAIENAHVEEQTGEDVDVAVHAGRAQEFSEEALTLAQTTQSRRLLAGAYIARGLTAANEFYQDWESARKFASEATGLIGPGESDHLAEDLSALKSRITQASGINDILRNWSEGMLGGKTFQQVSEEFAEIVIPKVWVREDKKIARVADRLSISPKKVRRVLRNAGWIESD